MMFCMPFTKLIPLKAVFLLLGYLRALVSFFEIFLLLLPQTKQAFLALKGMSQRSMLEITPACVISKKSLEISL